MRTRITESYLLLMQKGKSLIKVPTWLVPIPAISIYAMIIPAVIVDVFTWQYQNIFVRIVGMPRLYRRDYVVLDRGGLRGLNLFQRLHCVYCGYVNGVFAWAKDTVNITEVYTCAVKHKVPAKGQEHHEGFWEREEVG